MSWEEDTRLADGLMSILGCSFPGVSLPFGEQIANALCICGKFIVVEVLSVCLDSFGRIWFVMASNDPYQPPESKTTITHAPFSRDEWRAMGREFAILAMIGSLLFGLFLTWQTNYALKAFGATGRIGGIVAVSSTRGVSPMVILWAACTTLIAAMHNRRETQRPIPQRIVHVPAIAFLLIAYFPINLLVVGTSFLSATLYYGGSALVFWQSMQIVVLTTDIVVGIMLLSSLIAFFGAIGIHFARWFSRFRIWVPLRAFILLVICWNFSTFTARILGIISLFWRD